MKNEFRKFMLRQMMGNSARKSELSKIFTSREIRHLVDAGLLRQEGTRYLVTDD